MGGIRAAVFLLTCSLGEPRDRSWYLQCLQSLALEAQARTAWGCLELRPLREQVQHCRPVSARAEHIQDRVTDLRLPFVDVHSTHGVSEACCRWSGLKRVVTTFGCATRAGRDPVLRRHMALRLYLE